MGADDDGWNYEDLVQEWMNPEPTPAPGPVPERRAIQPRVSEDLEVRVSRAPGDLVRLAIAPPGEGRGSELAALLRPEEAVRVLRDIARALPR